MKYKLFVTTFCVYCKPIVKRIEEENLNIEVVNLSENREEQKTLLEVGGKMQVPMLLIGEDEGMYESMDIMNWIDENLEELKG